MDTLLISLRVMSAMLPTMSFEAERSAAAAVADFALATDYADYLAKHGVPFRDAHEAVGALVARCEREGRTFDELSLMELQEAHPAFEADALKINLASALAARNAPGGTAPVAVATAREVARDRLGSEGSAMDGGA